MSKLDLLVQEFEALNQKEETQVSGGFVSIENSVENTADVQAVEATNYVCGLNYKCSVRPNT